MKKRLFALASALILTFGMSVSVFAADSASTDTTTTTVTAVSVDTPLQMLRQQHLLVKQLLHLQ